MEKVYYLDLQTVIDHLQGQSALLSTSVDVPSLREACTGYLFLKEGMLVGSLIQSQQGWIVHSGAEAYALLSPKTQWQVRLHPNADHVFWSMMQHDVQRQDISPSPSVLSQTPRPVQPLEPHLLRDFTMKQRLVLRLVLTMANGERTLEQIKAQLHLPPEVVEEALATLWTLGILE